VQHSAVVGVKLAGTRRQSVCFWSRLGNLPDSLYRPSLGRGMLMAGVFFSSGSPMQAFNSKHALPAQSLFIAGGSCSQFQKRNHPSFAP
jgi:hypothetical protein